MVGRPVEALYPRSPRRRGAPILEVADFGPSGATFTLHRGEILGIAGLLGAGRTRLMRGLFGLEPVRSGRVRLGHVDGRRRTPGERWRSGCGFLSEDRKEEGLAAALSIADNMTLSRLDGLGPGPLVLPRTQDRAATRWMERLQIKSRSTASARRRALGRQPAEGRARAAPAPRRRRPAARRTDARHRRREQGADLRAHRRAGCRAPAVRRRPPGRERAPRRADDQQLHSRNCSVSAIASPSCAADSWASRARSPSSPSTDWCSKPRAPRMRR